jgi:hypothetical protein
MKHMVMVAALLVASADGAAAEAPEYKALKDRLVAEYFDCVRQQAVALDDRASDASTIARGAVAACAALEDTAVRALAGNYNNLVPPLREETEKRGIEAGIAALLRARVASRRAPVAPAKSIPRPKPKGESI